MDKKKSTTYLKALYTKLTSDLKTCRVKVKRWKNIYQSNENKKAHSNTCIRQKDFTTKTVVRSREGNYIMIKGKTQQEDITILNIYAPNIKALKT